MDVLADIPQDIPTQWNPYPYKFNQNNSMIDQAQRNYEIAEGLKVPLPTTGGCPKKHIQMRQDIKAGKKRTHLVRYDGDKKYISKNKVRIYLKDIRGKYVYVNT